MKYGLKSFTIIAIQDVLAHYRPVEQAILYGSRARGNYRHGSDIDLTLKGRDLDLSIQFKIEIELDDLLLPYTIDLSIFHFIENKDLINHIERIGVEFYNKSKRTECDPEDC